MQASRTISGDIEDCDVEMNAVNHRNLDAAANAWLNILISRISTGIT